MFAEYYTIDSDGDGTDEEYPVYKNYEAQRIPKTRDPMIINPLPGCFGYGPGPVKVKGPRLTLNTSSFVTYAQVKSHQSCTHSHLCKVYEVSLILSKDTGQDSGPRQAMVTVEIDVGVRTSERINLIACYFKFFGSNHQKILTR